MRRSYELGRDWLVENFTRKGLLALMAFVYAFVPDTLSRSIFWHEKWHAVATFLLSPAGRLAVVAVGIGILLLDHRSALHRPSSPSTASAFANPQWETVSRKEFRNEAVDLDGKRFYQCLFAHARLVYHGKAPVELIDCQMSAGVIFQTDNPAIVE